ncbi:MAG: hypothetical protein KAX32_02980, partial [Candidatus Heimdallarchaeota archaeon]|nr:hypothetical protein [Candidatus Heimdallarchaeota archaeon]
MIANSILLFFSILTLFFSDIIIQKFRYNNINLKHIEISISKYIFVILFIAFGVSLVSIGIQINAKYLIPGDSWAGISMAKYI